MSELHIIISGEQSAEKIKVFGKKRFVVPFIGVIEREYGPNERVVGLKCPTQEKTVMHPINSDNPLVYLRAFKMLSEVTEVTDEMVADCIIATQNDRRLENFSETSIYKKNGGSYRQDIFSEAQIKALAFKPSPEMVRKVVAGFALHLAPLDTQETKSQPAEDVGHACTTIDLKQHEVSAIENDRGCYKPLRHALETSAVSAATPSFA